MSMRLLLAAALAAAAGACAHAPQGKPDAPLAARLSLSASGMDVGLNDDAHIAVFAVTPGQGVDLVYPRSHERTSYAAGWTTLAHNPAGRSTFYEPRLVQFMSRSVSTVLVLVASREPINVRRFAAGASLERAMGHRVYRSYDADEVIGGIARLTVGDVPGTDWTMDVTAIPVTRAGAGYALLDEGRYPAENAYVTVYCTTPGAQGIVVVHMEFARYACPPADPEVESDSTATVGTGGASAVREPVTRRTFAAVEAEAAAAAVAEARTRRSAAREHADAARDRVERRVRGTDREHVRRAGAGRAAGGAQDAAARGGGRGPGQISGAGRGGGGERSGGERAPAGGAARNP
jgi:hypothetical protein